MKVQFHVFTRGWGSEAQFDVGVGTVDGLVATGAPAGALTKTGGVIARWTHRRGRSRMCVEVALQTQSGIALREHLLV